MKKFIVGIDVSSDKIDVHIVNADSKAVVEIQLACTFKGYDQLLRLCKKMDELDHFWFCFEHTGTYSLMLAYFLQTHECHFSVLPALQIKNSSGMTRGKTDQVDAQRIAEYAHRHFDTMTQYNVPSDNLLKIKQLLTRRSQLVRMRTQNKNSLKAHLNYEKLTKQKLVSPDINRMTKYLDRLIKKIEDQIQAILKEDEQVNQTNKLIQSVPGIGKITAAYLIMITQNFNAFDSSRKLNCYAGIAPFEHSSGKFKGRSRTSKLRNKHLKTLLMNGANAAVRHDPEFKRYYERKSAQGKAYNCIMNAICAKIIDRTFAVVKRQTPFVKLAQHNLVA